MSERKCPKCGGDVEEGFLPGAPHWKAGRGIFGLRGYRIFGYRCKIVVTLNFTPRSKTTQAKTNNYNNTDVPLD